MVLASVQAAAEIDATSTVELISVDPTDFLILSIVVLYVGFAVNRKVRFLSENFIPPAVTGGLLFSLLAAAGQYFFNVELEYNFGTRDVLLLVFFTTIGLSADFKALLSGGVALAKLVALAAVFLVIQDAVGVLLAVLTGSHPGYGLMAGSVSFAGGHGTAIAWGAEADAAGLEGAAEAGIAFATFGLIAGGLVGGPIARRLLRRNNIEPVSTEEESKGDADAPAEANSDEATAGELFSILGAILALAVCVEIGGLTNRLLFESGVLLPGFLTAMGAGVVIGNLGLGPLRANRVTLDRVGDVSLNIFLSMSLLSMDLSSLVGAFDVILLVIFVQITVMTFFAIHFVFRLMGRDYDACVIAVGFAGLGLGATPIAIANMNSVTSKFGPSTKAFLVVPLVGAFFIDILNAVTIKLFIAGITRWFE